MIRLSVLLIDEFWLVLTSFACFSMLLHFKNWHLVSCKNWFKGLGIHGLTTK